jgi:protein-tyrosine-phosphatase
VAREKTTKGKALGGNGEAQVGKASLDPGTDHLLRQGVERLAGEFRGLFGRETIDRYTGESVGGLAGAGVKRYLPIFAYASPASGCGRWLGWRAYGREDRPRIPFVCLRNTTRSQIVAALARHLSGGAIAAHSVGSAPAEQIDPAAVEVMRELGRDPSQEFPKPLADELVRAADVAVTMGYGDACPLHPCKRTGSIKDPAGQPLEKVREVRTTEKLVGQTGFYLTSARPSWPRKVGERLAWERTWRGGTAFPPRCCSRPARRGARASGDGAKGRRHRNGCGQPIGAGADAARQRVGVRAASGRVPRLRPTRR